MRGKKAKALRKIVYGDMSLRTPRKYLEVKMGRGRVIYNDPKSLRAKYQRAKALYRAGLINFSLHKKKAVS
jgi:hypothetical protein